MKAIITKYHGPTDSRGSRISATAEGVGRVYMPYRHELNGEENHGTAARLLRDKYGWRGDMVGGGMPSGGMAWVFVHDTKISEIKA